jgi:hypothetical protein
MVIVAFEVLTSTALGEIPRLRRVGGSVSDDPEPSVGLKVGVAVGVRVGVAVAVAAEPTIIVGTGIEVVP